MKVLLINDVAGQLDQLQAVLQITGGQNVDAVVVLGDLVVTAARQEVAVLEAIVGALPWSLANAVEDEIAAEEMTYADVFALLGSGGLPIYIIPGAHDDLAALDAARGRYQGLAPIMSVHGTAAALSADTVVAGLGGSISPAQGEWTMLEYPAKEVTAAFEYVARVRPRLWNLPQRILLFATAPLGESVGPQEHAATGATAVAAAIRRYQPAWVLYGGTGSRPRSAEFAGTRLINPGALQHGEYAVIDVTRGDVQMLHLGVTQQGARSTVLVSITATA